MNVLIDGNEETRATQKSQRAANRWEVVEAHHGDGRNSDSGRSHKFSPATQLVEETLKGDSNRKMLDLFIN
jgi:hypothetical protein